MYQKRYYISSREVHYGPLCPGENQLNLLGDIRGRRVLDLGCGGGQNAIALARMGAIVTAVDFSALQIEMARKLAQKHNATIKFLVADIGAMPELRDRTFDLALSACAIAFVRGLDNVFAEAHRLLKTGGRLVLSDMNPLQYILDETSDGVEFNRPYPIQPVLSKWKWDFQANDAKGKIREVDFQHYIRSIPQYANALIDSGFTVNRIFEPKSTMRTPHMGFSREIRQEYNYIAKHIPITFIITCTKQKRR